MNTGSGNDYISTGRGFDIVDGGYGFDLLNLDFSTNFSGVTSSLTSRDEGEYVSDESVVGFKNIEAVNVIGSQHDDVLVGFAIDSYWSDPNYGVFPISPMVDGGMGFDELVVDYSDSNQNLDININADYTATPPIASLDVIDNSGSIKSLDFNSIEALNVTTGRGDDNVQLGFDDEIVNTGAGNDYISTGRGFDIVDGGYGFDLLDLDFSTNFSGVTSNLTSSSEGEYVSNESVVGFKNIEAVNVIGSQHDDVLVGFAIDSYWSDPNYGVFPISPMVDGGMGFDELVVDYSDSNQNLNIHTNGNYTAAPPIANLDVIDNSGSIKSLDFNSIEALNVTTGRGDDNVQLGFDDEIVNTGAGNDYISTGRGFDIVDGGYGFDLLDLDFSTSFSGVTSSLTSKDKGEYVSSESVVSFKNIEAVNVIGSQHDDVLVGFAIDSYWSNPDYEVFPISPMVDGGMGFDELVVDYSDSNQNLNIHTNGNYTAAPPIANLDVIDNSGSIKSLDFNSIEALNVTTGRGDDNINLSFDNETINTGAGNDFISTGHGFDVIDGGSGFDVLNLDFNTSNSGVTSSLSDGDSGEYISDEGTVEFTNIEGVNIIGSYYDYVLVAPLHSNPNLPIFSYVDGGIGFDELVIEYSDNNRDFDLNLNYGNLNTFDYQTGNYQDLLSFSEIESFNITTGRGNNNINLNSNFDNYSDDTVNAGAGDDIISTGKGSDVVDGSSGYNILNLDFSSSVFSGVTSSLSDSNSGEYISDEGVVEFTNIEGVNVVGSSEGDLLYGLKEQNIILGEMGADTIVGGHSNDTINGGEGADSLNGNQGDDSLDGGKGIDTIYGDAGNDLINGNDDRDLLFGNAGNDTIEGGLGNDVLKGGTNNDMLFGGFGRDILLGNGGKDVFVLELDSSSDVIKDFESGEDKFGLTNELSFNDLSISSNPSGSAAVIRNVNDNEVIALASGIDPMNITSADFVDI